MRGKAPQVLWLWQQGGHCGPGSPELSVFTFGFLTSILPVCVLQHSSGMAKGYLKHHVGFLCGSFRSWLSVKAGEASAQQTLAVVELFLSRWNTIMYFDRTILIQLT